VAIRNGSNLTKISCGSAIEARRLHAPDRVRELKRFALHHPTQDRLSLLPSAL